MGILSRVEQIRSVEHLRLRASLVAVGAAIAEALGEDVAADLPSLEPGPAWGRQPAPRRVDMLGKPIAAATPTPTRAPARRRDVQDLNKAWEPCEEMILARLDRWEEVLWPLVRRWEDGEQVDDAVQSVAAELEASRAAIDDRLRRVRHQALFLPALSEPIRALFASLEQCDRVERGEVLPALLSGSRECPETERSHSADDVSRNLRAAAKQPKPAERPKDPLMRLLSWVGVARD